MTHHGIVAKVFTGPTEQYGILLVLDDQGHPTGDTLEFRFDQGVYPDLVPNGFDLLTCQATDFLCVDFSDYNEIGWQRLRIPREGDTIVYSGYYADDDGPSPDGAWTFLELAQDLQRKLQDRTFVWQLVGQFNGNSRPTRRLAGGTSSLRQIMDLKIGNFRRNAIDFDVGGDLRYMIQVQFPDGTWRNAKILYAGTGT